MHHGAEPGRQCDNSKSQDVEDCPRSYKDNAAALCWPREYEEVLDRGISTAEVFAKLLR